MGLNDFLCESNVKIGWRNADSTKLPPSIKNGLARGFNPSPSKQLPAV